LEEIFSDRESFVDDLTPIVNDRTPIVDALQGILNDRTPIVDAFSRLVDHFPPTFNDFIPISIELTATTRFCCWMECFLKIILLFRLFISSLVLFPVIVLQILDTEWKSSRIVPVVLICMMA
jgi:hypothetical protein